MNVSHTELNRLLNVRQVILAKISKSCKNDSTATYLLLVLLEPGEGDKELLEHILLSKELNGALVDAARAGDVVVTLLEPAGER